MAGFRVAVRGLLLLGLLAAIPWALVTWAPIPVPGFGRIRETAAGWVSDPGSRASSTIQAAGRLLQQPITDQLIVQALALAVWLIWAAFMLCLLAEAASLLSGIPAPHLPGLGSMQAVASWMLTGTVAGLLASSAVTTAPQAAPLQASAPASAPLSLPSSAPLSGTLLTAAETGTTGTTGVIGERAARDAATGDASTGRLVYVVRDGDWLGAIAHRFLGDYDAYERLRQANPGLIPDRTGPHGPNHIEPGWRLLLPSSARDRGPEAHATGRTTTRPAAEPSPGGPGNGATSGGPDGHDGQGSQSGQGIGPHETDSATATVPPSPSSMPSFTPSPGASSAPAGPGDRNGEQHPAGEEVREKSHDGVQFGRNWISWPLAISLAGVAALVWLARRRRYRYTEPFTYAGLTSDEDGAGYDSEFDGEPRFEGAGNDDFGYDESGYDELAEDTRTWLPAHAPMGSAEPDPGLRQRSGEDGAAGRDDERYDDRDAERDDSDEGTPLYWLTRNGPPADERDDTEGQDAGQGPARRSRRSRRAARADRADRLTPLQDDEDLQPMPAALNRIRLVVQAHSEAVAASLPTSVPEPLAQPAQPSQFPGGSPSGLGPTVPHLGTSAGRDSENLLDTETAGRQLPPVPGGLPPVGPSGAQLAGLADIPPEGAGLVGRGAPDAARALLVAALAAGGPADPDAAGFVVTTFDTLNALIGGPATLDVEGIPRLQVAADLDSALSILDEHILSRRRTLDEHDETDIQRLREEQPWSAPMPPVLLIAQAPPATAGPVRARLSTSLHLGGPLQVSGVLLGAWPRGQTLDLDADGRAAGPDAADGGTAGDTAPGRTRLAVIGAAEAIDLLAALAEALTGQPNPAPGPTGFQPPATPEQPSEHPSEQAPQPSQPLARPGDLADLADLAGPAGPSRLNAPRDQKAEPGTSSHPPPVPPGLADPADPADRTPAPTPGPAPVPDAVREQVHAQAAQRMVLPPPGQERIRLRVLGPPMVLDRDGRPVPGLRSGAAQVLVILAVHREGRELKDIMEKMWPDTPFRRAATRLSTEATNLRRCVRVALGCPDDKTPATNAVINTGGYYVLNENLVDLDLWQMQDLLNTAKDTPDPAQRIGLLQRAVAAHTGTLADGRDFPWADVVRHQIQRHGIRARLHLAQLLTERNVPGPPRPADLAQAAWIVAQAADADPVSEDLAQRAIRASAAAGDADAVRARLRTLRAALDEIDQEPTGETLNLAANITIAKPATPPGHPDRESSIAGDADHWPSPPARHDREDNR